MKKRTFYIVNLDRNRIMLLSVLLTGFILLAFATGYRFGHVPGAGDTNNSGFSGSLTGKKAASKLGVDRGSEDRKGSTTGDSSSRFGSSIYDLKNGSGKSGDTTDNTSGREKNGPGDINNSISMKSNLNRRPADDQVNKRASAARERQAREKRRLAERREARERRRTAERRKKIAARREAERRRSRLAAEKKTARLKRERHARSKRNVQDRRTAMLRPRSDPSRSFRNTSPNSGRTGAKDRSRRSYTVQVGAYRMKRSATRIASTLKRKGFGARVRRHRGHYFVMVGSASSKDQLRGLKKRLRQEKYPSFIIPAK